MANSDNWERQMDICGIVCPDCQFVFDICHTDGKTENHACPNCAEMALQARVRELEAFVGKAAKFFEEPRESDGYCLYCSTNINFEHQPTCPAIALREEARRLLEAGK